MFDIAWMELLVIGTVAVLVLGPKELPRAMRSMAKILRQAGRLKSEFQLHLNDLVRQADLEDLRRDVNAFAGKNIGAEARKLLDPNDTVGKLTSSLGESKQEVDKALAD